MNKKILAPLRSYNPNRVFYIYHEYIKMFKKANLDIITIAPASFATLQF